MTNQFDQPAGDLFLDGDIKFDNNASPFAGGGFGQLFIGTTQGHGKVAMKRLIMHGESVEKLKEQHVKTLTEARVWRALAHKHVLPFLGVLLKELDLYLVSPFVENGSLLTYLNSEPNADRILLVYQIADGLAFLHAQGVVHGDVKGQNVLIGRGPRAMLCDFGLSKILSATGASTGHGLGSVRWQSPELMQGGPRTFKSDVYAFGITTYETLSGKLPFHAIPTGPTASAIIFAVMIKNRRPSKDDIIDVVDGIVDAVWKIAEDCWLTDPQSRLSMPAVRQAIAGLKSFTAHGNERSEFIGQAMDVDIRQNTLSAPTSPLDPDARLTPRLGKRILDQHHNFSGRPFKYGPGYLENEVDSTEMIERFKRIESLPRARTASCHAQRPDAHSPCLDGTRTKVLAKLRIWAGSLDPACEKIFFISGMAGTGKSTIVQTIALECEDQDILGASFFFGASGEADLRTGERVITTLVYQLSLFDVNFKRHLAKALEAEPEVAYHRRTRQIQKLFVAPLQAIDRTDPVVIILDALDECVQQDAQEILELLLLAVSQVALPLKLLITSRPEPYITSVFAQSTLHRQIILHDIEAATVTGDIRFYLHHHLTQSAGCLRGVSGIKDEDVEALVTKSGQLFVYAATVVRFLSDNRFRSPLAQLQIMLDTHRSSTTGALDSIDGLYLRLLDTAAITFGKQVSLTMVQNVVGAILFLHTPLSLEALERLLGLETGMARAVLYPLHSVIVTPADDSQPATIYHQSFSDFIRDPNRCIDPRFLIVASSQEHNLAIKTLLVLKGHLKRNIAEIPRELLMEVNENIPHLRQSVDRIVSADVRYACEHWADHVSNVHCGEKVVLELVTDLVRNRALWWLEALSVLGNVSRAVVMMISVIAWATTSGAPDDLIRLLNDLRRFILAHSAVIQRGAQHIYLSALPYVPRKSKLWESYQFEAEHSITPIGDDGLQWSQCLSVLDARGAVSTVACSPDGSRLVSGALDGTMKIWDSVSGALIDTLEGHTERVWAVIFSTDGSRIASSSSDRTARIWNQISRVPQFVLTGHDSYIRQLAFSQDGSRIASGSDDTTVRIWDGLSGKHLITLIGHVGLVCAVTFSPDGLKVMSSSRDKTVRIWSAVSGIALTTLTDHSAVVRSVTFSPDGSRIVSGSDDRTIMIWNGSSGAHLKTLTGHTDGVATVVFSPKGTVFASGSADKTARIWDGTSGVCIHCFEGHASDVSEVAFSPDGTLLASGSDDATVRIWQVVSGSCLAALMGHSNMIDAVAFVPNSSRIISSSSEGGVRIWDSAFEEPLASFETHSAQIRVIKFSQDGARIASASDDETVLLWDATLGSSLFRLVGHSGWLRSLAFSPEGLQIATGSEDSTIRLWELRTGRHIRTLEGHTGWVRAVAFSPDGLCLASGASDGTVRLWGRMSAVPAAVFPLHTEAVMEIAFSPDASRLASCSLDRTLWIIWIRKRDIGDIVIHLEGHVEGVSTIVFSSDGLLLASGSFDATVRIWDGVSGVHLNTLQADHGPVWELEFSADGSVITSFAEKGTTTFNIATGQALPLPIESRRGGIIAEEADEASVGISTHAMLDEQMSSADIGNRSYPVELSPPRQVDFEGQWMISRSLGVQSRLCYISDEFQVGIWATFPPDAPTKVAIGCVNGRVLILDLATVHF